MGNAVGNFNSRALRTLVCLVLAQAGCGLDQLVAFSDPRPTDAGADVNGLGDVLGPRDAVFVLDGSADSEAEDGGSDVPSGDTVSPEDAGVDGREPDVIVIPFCDRMNGLITCTDFEDASDIAYFSEPPGTAVHERTVVAHGTGALRTTYSGSPARSGRSLTVSSPTVWVRADIRVSETFDGQLTYLSLYDTATNYLTSGMSGGEFSAFSPSTTPNLFVVAEDGVSSRYRCMEIGMLRGGPTGTLEIYVDGALHDSKSQDNPMRGAFRHLTLGVSWDGPDDRPDPPHLFVYYDNLVVSSVRNPCPAL